MIYKSRGWTPIIRWLLSIFKRITRHATCSILPCITTYEVVPYHLQFKKIILFFHFSSHWFIHCNYVATDCAKASHWIGPMDRNTYWCIWAQLGGEQHAQAVTNPVWYSLGWKAMTPLFCIILQCDYPCILLLLHTSGIYMCIITVPSGYDVKSANYFYLYTYAVLVLDTRLDVLYLKET